MIRVLADAYRARPRADAAPPGDGPRRCIPPWPRCARAGGPRTPPALDDLTFVAHLARCAAPGTAGPNPSTPRTCTWLRRPGRLGCCRRATASRHRATRHRLPARDRDRPHVVDEVEQRLWEVLLVGTGGGSPRLASYSGKGPLAAFLGIAAQRIALDNHRHRSAEQRAVARAGRRGARPWRPDAELAFIKAALPRRSSRAR